VRRRGAHGRGAVVGTRLTGEVERLRRGREQRRADGHPLGGVLIGPVNTALIGLAEKSSLPLRIIRPMAAACRSPLITISGCGGTLFFSVTDIVLM